MRWTIFLIPTFLKAAITLGVVSTTATQAIIPYSGMSNSSIACKVEVSSDPSFATVANDNNPALFTSAQSDARAGSIGSGTRSRTYVAGLQATQVDLTGHKTSRALFASTHYYFRINNDSACDPAGPVSGQFTTGTIKMGRLHNELASGLPGGLVAYPEINSASPVADPMTGAPILPLNLPGDMPNHVHANQAFMSPIDPLGTWGSCTSLPCSTTGGSGKLILPANLGLFGSVSYENTSPNYLDYFRADITGTSSTGAVVNGCIVLNNGGGTCATQSNSVAFGGSSATYPFGNETPGMAIWMPFITAPDHVLVSQHVMAVTISGSTVTYADTNNEHFRPTWGAGTIVNLNGTGCSNQNFTMAFLVTDTSMTLTTSPGCSSATMTVTPFAFALYTSGQATITAAVYQEQDEFGANIDSSAMQDGTNSCGGPPIIVGGQSGYLCYATEAFYWVSAQSQQRNYLGIWTLPSNSPSYGSQSLPATPNVCAFDLNTAGLLTCGVVGSNGGTYLVKLQFSGPYTAVAQGTAITSCGPSPCLSSITQLSPSGLTASAIAYSSTFAASCCAFGPIVSGENSDGTIQVQFHNTTTQNYTGFESVFDPVAGNFIAMRPTTDIGSTIHSVIPCHGSKLCYGPELGGYSPASVGPLSGNGVVAGDGPYRVVTTSAGISGTRVNCPAYTSNPYISAAWWPGGANNTAPTTDCVSVPLASIKLEDPSPFSITVSITVNVGSTTVNFTSGTALPIYAGKTIVISMVNYTFAAGSAGYTNSTTMTLSAPYAGGSNYSGTATIQGETLCSGCATSPAYSPRNLQPGDVLFPGYPTAGVGGSNAGQYYSSCHQVENSATTECFLVLSIVGSTAILQGKYSPGSTVQAWTGTVYLYLDSQINNFFVDDGQSYYISFWDYVNFPSGEPFYVSAMNLAPANAHNYQTAKASLGLEQNSTNCPATQTTWNGLTWNDCYSSRSSPIQFNYVNLPFTVQADNAPFSIWLGMGNGTGDPPPADDHPTYPYLSAQSTMNSARVMNGASGSPATSGAPCTNKGGSLYLCTAAQRGFQSPAGTNAVASDKVLPVGAFCGIRPAVNVSGPGVTIGGTISDGYKYVLAVLANEGISGSSPGDLVINCPYASAAYSNIGQTDIGQLGNGGDVIDISVIPAGPWIHKIVQNEISQAAPNGERSRVISSAMRPHDYNIFSQGRATPDNLGILFQSLDNDGWKTQMLMAALPPIVFDSVNGADYVPIRVPLPAPPAGLSITAAIAEYGYEEYGNPATGLFCTQRQETCVKGNQSGTLFNYETTEAWTGQSCTSGCTINIPALSQRILYYRTKYLNGSSVVLTSPISVMAVQ